MKKTFIALVLAILACVSWLILHRSQSSPKEVNQPLLLPLATNAPTSTAPPLTIISSNALGRPGSIDEDRWRRLMQIRQLALEQNQPVEFYVRVLDQSERPIGGAKLTLKLTRTDENMFTTTNFFHQKMGDEVLTIPIEMTSDETGWIRVSGTNGYFLDMVRLTKEGYSSSYPDGNFGGIHYEANGERTTYGGDILMTNAWNPNVGYTFHLEKK